MLRRLLSLDYVLEYPQLSWLPTEQEKVGFFESLGIDRRRIPHRIYQGAVGKQTRYFALQLPIAVDTKTATFAYVDPGKDTDTERCTWGATHEWLWRALREQGLGVQVVVIGADHTATRRSKAALQSWSNGASEQGVHKAEGPTQDDPAVKAEMQQIEDVMRRGDRAGLSKYGGFQGATLRLIEIKKTSPIEGSIRGLYRRLRDVGFTSFEDAGCGAMNRRNGVPISGAIQDCFYCAPCTMPVPIQPGTQTRGGSVPGFGDAVYQHHGSYLFAATRLVRKSPASPQRSSGKGQDGSDPPLFAAVSANGEGGVYQPVYHRLPPFSGVAPVRFIPTGRFRTRTPSGR